MPRYRFTSTDKITGRTFRLCAEARTEKAASEIIWEMGFLVSEVEKFPWDRDSTLKPKMDDEYWEWCNRPESESPVEESERRKIGKVYRRDSYNAKQLCDLFNTKCDPIERYWLLHDLISLSKSKHEAPWFKSLTELFCWQWMAERNTLVKALVEGDKFLRDRGFAPEILALHTLFEMHEGQRGVDVCRLALTIPYPDASYGVFKNAIEEAENT